MNKTYYYKGKPYKVLLETKAKASGFADAMDVDRYDASREWIDVVIYECLYENPDGMVWVRTKEQFYNLFTTEP